MRRRADLSWVPFRQEGYSAAIGPGDFLDRMLGNGVMVGAIKRFGITDVELFLPGLGLALGVFHRDPSRKEMVAHRAHDALFLGGLQDMVILIVGADRRQFAIPRTGQITKALLEQEELELGRHHRRISERLEPRDLDLQDLPRRLRDRLMGVVVEKIAQHHCGSLEPGHAPHGGEIRLHHIIAVARLPAGRRVAVRGRHFEVGGKHVVAAMSFLMA
jgi:hypothetical protein